MLGFLHGAVVTSGLSPKATCKQRAKLKVELLLNLRGISLDQLYGNRDATRRVYVHVLYRLWPHNG